MSRILLSLWLVICAACPLAAQEQRALTPDPILTAPFTATGLSADDKRFLQTALAFEGHYSGLIDGAWGGLSQEAIQGFAAAEFDGTLNNLAMAGLALGLVGRIDADGWTWHHFDAIGLSLLFPAKTAVLDQPSERFANWRHGASSLAYSVGVLPRDVAVVMHDYTLRRHQTASEPYTLRKPSLAVTAITRADGATLYTRSDYVDGGWPTVMLSADKADGPLLNAVSASLTTSRTTALSVTQGGKLDRSIRAAIALFDAPTTPAPATAAPRSVAPSAPPSAPPRTDLPDDVGVSTGSGFYVSEAGHVLTNAHVIEGCAALRVDGETARVLASAPESDLALLETATRPSAVARFSASPARLNSDVTALGYPFAHLLGGLNVTRGAVSSMTGLAGNPDTMQITAPVQPGNSGGPLVGADGAVVGVVVAKLDALKIADSLGDIPQNINFAVRGEVARAFLKAHDVPPRLAGGDDRLAPEDLAERGAGFTAFIECLPR